MTKFSNLDCKLRAVNYAPVKQSPFKRPLTELQQRGQIPMVKQVRKRKWAWVGHTLRRPSNSITRQALHWNPQGKRKRGRPKNSWRRDTEKEMKILGKNWKELQQLAEKRRLWRLFVDGPCSNLEPRA